MNIINEICLYTGYLLWGTALLLTFMWLYFHLWINFAYCISQIRMCKRGNVKIKWFKFFYQSIKNLRHMWYSEEQHIYKDIGTWTIPKNIYSLGTYEWYEKAEKTIDNVEKSL